MWLRICLLSLSLSFHMGGSNTLFLIHSEKMVDHGGGLPRIKPSAPPLASKQINQLCLSFFYNKMRMTAILTSYSFYEDVIVLITFLSLRHNTQNLQFKGEVYLESWFLGVSDHDQLVEGPRDSSQTPLDHGRRGL